jgi:hypothetical protein
MRCRSYHMLMWVAPDVPSKGFIRFFSVLSTRLCTDLSVIMSHKMNPNRSRNSHAIL